MSGTVYEYALALLGETDESRAALLQTYCTVCQQQLTARLRPGVERAAISEAFDVAAALMAAAMYRDTADGSGAAVESFKVGDAAVSFGTGSGGELRGAALMRRQAELIMARYVAAGDGLLLGVPS